MRDMHGSGRAARFGHSDQTFKVRGNINNKEWLEPRMNCGPRWFPSAPKLLQMDVPPLQVITLQILTVDH